MAIVTDEPYTGRSTFQKSVAIIKPDQNQVMSFWLYYYLSDKKEYLIGFAGGTAQKNLLLRDLRNFKVQLSPLDIQRKVVLILAAYDHLIENNTRRIKILEEMAQNLYREWFVNFCFPGHERTKLVDSGSDLGQIPEGWKISDLGEIIDVLPGYAFKSRDWRDRGIPVVKIKNITLDKNIDLNNVDYIDPILVTKSTTKFFLKSGDFLVAMTGATAGKTGKLRTSHPVLLNQRVAKIIPYELYQEYVWEIIGSEEGQNRFFKLADGAAQPNMSSAQISSITIVLPPSEIISKFSKIISPIHLQIDNLIFRNKNLKKTRDLLLPKLISGEINVESLDIEKETIAA